MKVFTTEELQAIDAKYFRMIVLDPYDLTIQSKCTGHYWYLHSTGYPSDGSCIIFHKHRYQHPYHQHGRARTLRQAMIRLSFSLLFGGILRWGCTGSAHTLSSILIPETENL